MGILEVLCHWYSGLFTPVVYGLWSLSSVVYDLWSMALYMHILWLSVALVVYMYIFCGLMVMDEFVLTVADTTSMPTEIVHMDVS